MDTPICDFVSEYNRSSPTRLHMPGHKGSGPLGIEGRDITEITGADVLYHAGGIILQSERNAAALFGTAKTLYSCEGSSLCIRAMLYLIACRARAAGRKPLILAARNAHKVFITAAALLDIDVEWLFPEISSGIVSCPVSAAALEKRLSGMSALPDAVYITSPDYLGTVADIAGLSAVCRTRGILLAVDNAHGAYLRFLPESSHPIDLGADICCDSAHKTLPVITGGAYLHISPSAPAELSADAENALSLFATTSPSYLILQSLDAANAYLAGSFRAELESTVKYASRLRAELSLLGFTLCGDEPLKLTLMPKDYGYTGEELGSILEMHNIYFEFADPDYLVLMLDPRGNQELSCLYGILSTLPRRQPVSDTPPALPVPERVFSPHDILFLPSAVIPVQNSAGRIIASPTVSCPPAIPIVSMGERISPEAAALMEYYGIESVSVAEI